MHKTDINNKALILCDLLLISRDVLHFKNWIYSGRSKYKKKENIFLQIILFLNIFRLVNLHMSLLTENNFVVVIH
jgi:hypothetical protein